MADLPIPAEAIEAAAKAMYPAAHGNGPSGWDYATKQAERAIVALGVEVERREAKMDAAIPHSPAYRLVSRWFPVKP